MKDKIIGLMVIVVVIILVGIGISKSSNKASGEVIKIGATESLTGSAAYYGETSKKGIDLGMDWLAEKYPNVKFEIYHEDNQFNPKVSVDAYANLRNLHNVDAVITQTSPAAVAIEPLAQKDGILQMAISASAVKYTTPDDLTFRMTGSAILEAIPMVAYINKSFKKVAFLNMNNEIGVSAATAVQDGLKKSGSVVISSSDGFEVSSNDFRTLLLKVKTDKPDAVYIAGLTSHILAALKQMKELGINATLLTFRTGDDETLIKTGGDLVEGMVFSSNFADDSTNPEVLDFVKRYEVKYGDKPNSYAAEGYDAVRFVGKAFVKCGKDYSCIQKYLSSIKDEPSLFGNISFNNDGDIFYDFFLKTIKGGKFVEVK
jgi:branched-chain amino acid transport system substrate-binding protein